MSEIPEFLNRGGPALWAIAALSVLTLALILWKLWRLVRHGVWRRRQVEIALSHWVAGQPTQAMSELSLGTRSLRAHVLLNTMQARMSLGDEEAREETARHARAAVLQTREGLRALELIVTIAPLLGLLGTVLGMIDAFQALQATGNRAEASALAGGIWEALLTTAAGMGVAIPASIALTAFDGVAEALGHDLEDLAAQVFTAPVARAQSAGLDAA
ncbi:MotA/TolQ/ExbB proton channel family protein [Pseudoponticoccus marisrubri]|uniref:MotA/TolQ/ExbB proton channel domain-containing protein n=1 Tax=Pseudoponticoccus marisrubri TaxID=1685382 RepID=A0A0W7WL36_9RHOB|nr:MotA/TolQ/ExbB proton channel family protein [Pseudoponticoccus marisrubri]KUF11239.1 hypothetical protein AVJ23_09330 [Pseudoponticoccus marisrubri]